MAGRIRELRFASRTSTVESMQQDIGSLADLLPSPLALSDLVTHGQVTGDQAEKAGEGNQRVS
jgi:hypothetical protein